MSETPIPREYLDEAKTPQGESTSPHKVIDIEVNEREITDAHVHLKFYFSGHATREDANKLAQDIQESDVYIPEVKGWDANAAKFFNEVSIGERDLDSIINDAEKSGAKIDPFRRRVAELLYASRKPIVLVDVPYGHESASRVSAEVDERIDDFSTAIGKTRRELKEEADNQISREGYILTELQSQLASLKTNYPTLASKSQIKVFMQIGAAHTRISHQFIKDDSPGLVVTRVFSEKPFLYLPYSEAIRRNMFNKEVDDNLVAKVLLMRMVDHKISSLTSDTDQLAKLSKTISDGYSTEEIEDLYNVFRNSKSWNEFDSFFVDDLVRKGVTLSQQL